MINIELYSWIMLVSLYMNLTCWAKQSCSVIMSSKCHDVILQLGEFLRFWFHERNTLTQTDRAWLGNHLSAPSYRITLCLIFQICAYFSSTHNRMSVMIYLIASGFICLYNWLILFWLLLSGADTGPTYIAYCACLLAPWMDSDDYEEFNSTSKYVLSDLVCMLSILYLLAMLKGFAFCITWHMSQIDSWLPIKHLPSNLWYKTHLSRQ